MFEQHFPNEQFQIFAAAAGGGIILITRRRGFNIHKKIQVLWMGMNGKKQVDIKAKNELMIKEDWVCFFENKSYTMQWP